MKGCWSSTRVVGQQCQVSQLGFNNWSKLSTPLHTFSSILLAQILYVALFIRSEFKLILETWRQACFSSRRRCKPWHELWREKCKQLLGCQGLAVPCQPSHLTLCHMLAQLLAAPAKNPNLHMLFVFWNQELAYTDAVQDMASLYS